MLLSTDFTNILLAVTIISPSFLETAPTKLNATNGSVFTSKPRSISNNVFQNHLQSRIMPRMHHYGCSCPHLPTCINNDNVQNVDILYLALGGIVGYLLSNIAALATIINTPLTFGRLVKENKSIPRAAKDGTSVHWMNIAEEKIAPAALLLLDNFIDIASNPSCAGRLFCKAQNSFNRHQTLQNGFKLLGSAIANIFTLDPVTAVESTFPFVLSSASMNCVNVSPNCAQKA